MVSNIGPCYGWLLNKQAFNVTYRDILSRFRYFIDEPGLGVTFRVTVPFGSVDV